MKERGIPFSAPMVRALQAGTKTQTRRALRVQPAGEWAAPGKTACPYGQPGDRLWVREAFRTYADYDGESMGKMQARLSCTGDEMTRVAPIQYIADDERRNWLAADAAPGRYRHARFMPRWASRTLLEVTSVRVERLQAISEVDCIAEGAPGGHGAIPGYGYAAMPCEHYRHIWEGINGAGSWDRNDWVWAVSFRKVQPC